MEELFNVDLNDLPNIQEISQKETTEETTEETTNTVEDTTQIEIETPQETSQQETSQQSTEGEFLPLYKVLQDEGIIEVTEDMKGEDFSELTTALNQRVSSQVNSYKESLPDEIKSLINNYEEGVPLKDLIETKSRQIEYNTISEDKLKENETLQEKLVFTELTQLSNYTEDEAKEFIEDLKDTGKLERTSLRSKGRLDKFEKQQEEQIKLNAKEAQAKFQREQQETLKTIATDIDSTAEIIPGIKISKADKEKMYKSLTEVVDTIGPNNQPVSKIMQVRSKDPVKFDKTIAYLVEMTNGFTDWSKVAQNAQSANMKQLKNQLSGNAAFNIKPKTNNKTTEDIRTMMPQFED